MNATLRIGWAILLALTIADTLEYAAGAHPVRAAALACAVLLLILLRHDLTHDLTHQERGER